MLPLVVDCRNIFHSDMEHYVGCLGEAKHTLLDASTAHWAARIEITGIRSLRQRRWAVLCIKTT